LSDGQKGPRLERDRTTRRYARLEHKQCEGSDQSARQAVYRLDGFATRIIGASDDFTEAG
jgi:hypothetical protein